MHWKINNQHTFATWLLFVIAALIEITAVNGSSSCSADSKSLTKISPTECTTEGNCEMTVTVDCFGNDLSAKQMTISKGGKERRVVPVLDVGGSPFTFEWPVKLPPGTYDVTMKIGGDTISGSKTVTVHNGNSNCQKGLRVHPNSGPPGEQEVKLDGDFKTSKFTSSQSETQGSGILDKIAMKGSFNGIANITAASLDVITVKIFPGQATSNPGNINFTVVDKTRGNWLPESVEAMGSDGKSTHYEIYPEISDIVAPATCMSTLGGGLITIKGNGLNTNTKVFISYDNTRGKPCKVIGSPGKEGNLQTIVCETPAHQEVPANTQCLGGRGTKRIQKNIPDGKNGKHVFDYLIETLNWTGGNVTLEDCMDWKDYGTDGGLERQWFRYDGFLVVPEFDERAESDDVGNSQADRKVKLTSKSDDYATLYLGDDRIFRNKFTRENDWTNERIIEGTSQVLDFTVNEGKPFKLAYAEDYGAAYVNLLMWPHCVGTNKYSDKLVMNEVHEIIFNSTLKNDIQTIEFVNLTDHSATDWTWTITIESAQEDDEIYFLLFRTKSHPFHTKSSESSDSVIQNKLAEVLELVFGLDEEPTVTVTDRTYALLNGIHTHTLSIKTSVGIGPLEVKSVVGNDVNFTVTAPTSNVDQLEIIIAVGDTASGVITNINDETEVNRALQLPLYSVTTIRDQISNESLKIATGFEPSDEIYDADTRVRCSDPFNGYYCVRGQTGQTEAVLLTQDEQIVEDIAVCLAHRVKAGYDSSMALRLRVKFSYGGRKSGSAWLEKDLTISVNWKFQCFHIKSDAEVSARAAAGINSVIVQKIEEIQYRWTDEDAVVDVDELIIAILSSNQLASLNDGSNWLRKPSSNVSQHIAALEVESIDTSTEGGIKYQLSVTTQNCFNHFLFYKPVNMPVHETSTDEMTFNASSNGESYVISKKVNAAHPPLNGTFKLAGCEEFISSFNKTGLERCLSVQPGVGDVIINMERNCFSVKLSIEFISVPGCKNYLTVVNSTLTPEGDVSTSLTRPVQSHKQLRRTTGLCRTKCNGPQVLVFTNGVPAKCGKLVSSEYGCGCSFSWCDSKTPNVTGNSPTTSTQASCSSAMTFNITGTNLIQDANDDPKVTLTLGNSKVTASIVFKSNTRIEFSMICEHKGTYSVSLKNRYGNAIVPSNVKVECSCDVTSLSPSHGHTGGGYEVNATGSGFGATDGPLKCNVTMDNRICTITANTSTLITFVVPPLESSKSSIPQSETVRIICNGALLGTQTFNYNATTAKITAIDSSALTVDGGNILFTCDNCGSEPTNYGEKPHIYGGLPLSISSWTSTAITGTVAAGEHPGTFTPSLHLATGGAASLYEDSIANVTLDPRITSITPGEISYLGGVNITINGHQFTSDTSQIDISTDGHMTVEPLSASSTQLLAHVALNQKTYKVSLYQDKDELIVPGWDVRTQEVYPKDRVNFTWTCRSSTKLVQMVDHNMLEEKSDGISSSSGTRGAFPYQFLHVGDYYFRACGASVRVRVIARQASDLTVNMKMRGFTIGTASSSRKKRSTSTSSANTIGTASTPTITNISPCEAYADSEITINGTNFGTSSSAIQVKFDSYVCNVASAITATHMTCTLNHCSSMETGLYDVKASINNVGEVDASSVNCQLKINSKFTGLTPTIVAPEGGAKMTATGCSVSKLNMVLNDPFEQLSAASTTNDEVTGIMPSQGTRDSAATIKFISCDPTTADNCYHSTEYNVNYDNSKTVTITDVSPTTISGQRNTLTLTGTNMVTVKEDIIIKVGSEECVVDADNTATSTTTTCELDEIEATAVLRVTYTGTHGIAVMSAAALSAIADCTSLTPTMGSIHGGTSVTVCGSGWASKETVKFAADFQIDAQVSTGCVTVVTQAHAVGAVNITVSVDSENEPLCGEFTFDDLLNITSTSPTQSLSCSGATLQITVQDNLPSDTSKITVTLKGSSAMYTCTISTVSNGVISCTMPSIPPATYDIVLFVDGVGYAGEGHTIECQWSVTSGPNPIEGSFGGGLTLTLAGQGLSSGPFIVQFCDGSNIAIDEGSSDAQLLVTTPAIDVPDTATETTCSVKVTLGDRTVTAPSSFTYKTSLTPNVTNITPTSGASGGGVNITISGTGFSTTTSDMAVTIEGVTCTLRTVSATNIICTTGYLNRSSTANNNNSRKKRATSTCDTASIVVMPSSRVVVARSGQGAAIISSSVTFSYVDRWSNPLTWNNKKPVAGDIVVIPLGLIVLLDESPPRLLYIIIQGGQLIVEDTRDYHLQADVILIVGCGVFQVGTEEKPFLNNFLLTLWGHIKVRELPIYGTKVLAVREGILDLHGKPIASTWTVLGATASVGDTRITLAIVVTGWKVGDLIVIASTGHHMSQSENEERTITAISIIKNQTVITFAEGLEYEHLGVSETLENGKVLEMRAEVGLLTRNVKVRGSDNAQWHDKIEACEEVFNPGEFAVQTCFEGRFGEDVGNDQYGAQIMMHGPVKNNDVTVGRFSHVELNYVGQAFRLGRYPIHFHLNGQNTKSYVRGCAIHKSFNRAVNIHGTHNVTIEYNVIYNIMGGAFFLEDGVETDNTFSYNLAVFVISSTSLLNDDITPAAFWATNPDNTFEHNHVAGGTHFGFWYRMHSRPDGPSSSESVCPDKVKFGLFFNNTVHSQGWFGVWIFQNYFPHEDGCAGKKPVTAVFKELITWHVEKGFEMVKTSSVTLQDSLLVASAVAGIDVKFCKNKNDFSPEKGGYIYNTIIAATTTQYSGNKFTTSKGLVLPYGFHFQIKNITFIGFDKADTACFQWTEIQGTCAENCGAFTAQVECLSFYSSPNRMRYRWKHEGALLDVDGSYGHGENTLILPTMGHLPEDAATDQYAVGDITGSYCSADNRFVRVGINNPTPSSLKYKNMIFDCYDCTTGEDIADCRTISPFRFKSMTHPKGWVLLLRVNSCYHFSWENAEHVTNVSYNVHFYYLKSFEWIILRHTLYTEPDMVLSTSSAVERDNNTDLRDNPEASSGDWFSNSSANNVAIRASGCKYSDPDRMCDSRFKVQMKKCVYPKCILPPDPALVRVSMERPDTAISAREKDLASQIDPITRDLRIAESDWYVLDYCDLAFKTISNLYLDGHLECDLPAGIVCEISAKNIIVNFNGGLICGWPNKPYEEDFTITLRGNTETMEDYKYSFIDDLTPSSPDWGAPEFGATSFGGCGRIYLNGKERKSWTNLESTAAIGATQITLSEAVDWKNDEEILITTTSYGAQQNEVRKITNIDATNKIITLNESLTYQHICVSTNQYRVCAEVALLKRNLVVQSDPTDAEAKAGLYGGRVFMGTCGKGKDISYVGRMSLKNVEFRGMGQEGFYDDYDPRFAVAFYDSPIFDSGVADTDGNGEVKNCVFINGYSPAVGMFGGEAGTITGNTIYGVIEEGIKVTSGVDMLSRNISGNLVSNITWAGGLYNETNNIFFRAAIDVHNTDPSVFDKLDVYDNVVAGGERTAYHIPAHQATDSKGPPDDYKYRNNIARGVLAGLVFLPPPTHHTPGVSAGKALYVGGFTMIKCYDYGIYIQVGVSAVVDDVTLVDCGQGVYFQIMGPASVSHKMGDKEVYFTNSKVIGRSAEFTSADDFVTTPNYISQSSQARNCAGGRHVALCLASFASGSNNAPKKPWKNMMNYGAISGYTIIKDMYFDGFGTYNGQRDVILMTNTGNEDVIHPAEVSGIKFGNSVDEDSKGFFARATIGAINPSDCVDMECDGLKHFLIKDLDGSFSGTTSARNIIGQSEFAWYHGDRRRGISDARIPKSLQTDADGNRLLVSDIAPNKGIYKDMDTCTNKTIWQAWQCDTTVQYAMMVIESTDEDTELRRLSPVALLSNQFLDLVNGPQDHGWCAGYTCQKRLSTFWPIVACNQLYNLTFSGTTPQNYRLRLLRSTTACKMVVSVFFNKPQRYNVYVNDVLRLPFNVESQDPETKKLTYDQSKSDVRLTLSDPTGSNMYIRSQHLLSFVFDGTQKIDAKISTAIVLSFTVPEVTVDEFFEENLVNNIATFLGIDPSKITIANIVRADSTKRKRKKRATDMVEVEFEISPPPPETVAEAEETAEESTTEMQGIFQQIVDTIQAGNGSDLVGMDTVEGFIIKVEPLPPPNSTEWQEIADPTTTTTSTTTTTTTTPATSGESTGGTSAPTPAPETTTTTTVPPTVPGEILVPHEMKLVKSVVPSQEGAVFYTPPQLHVIDNQGRTVTLLSSSSKPWRVAVTLRTTSNQAELTGTTELAFDEGYANFDDLVISSSGEGFYLDFQVVYPETFKHFKLSAGPLKVGPDRMVINSVSGRHEGAPFSPAPQLRIVDVRGNTVSAATGSNWRVQVTMRKTQGVSDNRAQLIGPTTLTFTAGVANFGSLGISHSGSSYYLDFRVLEPVQYTKYQLTVGPLTVTERPLLLSGATYMYEQTVDVPFVMVLRIKDAVTHATVTDLAWKGWNWTVNLYADTSCYDGRLLGGGRTQFHNNGTIDLPLTFTEPGYAWISAQVETTPTKTNYSLHFTTSKPFEVYHPWFGQDTLVKADKKKVMLEIKDSSVLNLPAADKAKFAACISNTWMEDYFTKARISNSSIEMGEVFTIARRRRAVTGNETTATPTPPKAFLVVYMSASSENLTTVLQDLTRKVQLGELTYTYNGVTYPATGNVLVDGEEYSLTNEASDGMSLGVILGIVFSILAVLLIVIVIIIACHVCNASNNKKGKGMELSTQDLMQSKTSLELRGCDNDVIGVDEERLMTSTPIFRVIDSPIDAEKVEPNIPGSVKPPRRLQPLYDNGSDQTKQSPEEEEQGFKTIFLTPSPVTIAKPKVKDIQKKNKNQPTLQDPNWFGWYDANGQPIENERPPSVSSYSDLAEPSA